MVVHHFNNIHSEISKISEDDDCNLGMGLELNEPFSKPEFVNHVVTRFQMR